MSPDNLKAVYDQHSITKTYTETEKNYSIILSRKNRPLLKINHVIIKLNRLDSVVNKSIYYYSSQSHTGPSNNVVN